MKRWLGRRVEKKAGREEVEAEEEELAKEVSVVGSGASWPGPPPAASASMWTLLGTQRHGPPP